MGSFFSYGALFHQQPVLRQRFVLTALDVVVQLLIKPF